MGGGKMSTYTNKYERDAMRGANKFVTQTGQDFDNARAGYLGYDPVQQFYAQAPQAQLLAQQTIDPYQTAARNFAASEAARLAEEKQGMAANAGWGLSSAARRVGTEAAQGVLQGNEVQLAQQKAAMDQYLYGINANQIGARVGQLGQVFGQAGADRQFAQGQRNNLGATIGTNYYQPGAFDYAMQGAQGAAAVGSAMAGLPPGANPFAGFSSMAQGAGQMFGGLGGQNHGGPAPQSYAGAIDPMNPYSFETYGDYAANQAGSEAMWNGRPGGK